MKVGSKQIKWDALLHYNEFIPENPDHLTIHKHGISFFDNIFYKKKTLGARAIDFALTISQLAKGTI
jgi:hypothetical protein